MGVTAEEETRALVAELTDLAPPEGFDRMAALGRLAYLVSLWRGQWIIVDDWIIHVVDGQAVLQQGKVL